MFLGIPKETPNNWVNCTYRPSPLSRPPAVLVEDTSLCFNALGGMPGPYVKWFLDEMGSAGLYKLLDGHEDKTAVAVCNVGFACGPGADPIVFCGQTHGTIVAPREGEKVFGWDNIFRPQGFDKVRVRGRLLGGLASACLDGLT